MHFIQPTKPYVRSLKKIVSRDKKLKEKIRKCTKLLAENPHYPSLKTHKAETKKYGFCYSSWVTGDIRIIWNFDKENQIMIFLLDVGRHSGSRKVYR